LAQVLTPLILSQAILIHTFRMRICLCIAVNVVFASGIHLRIPPPNGIHGRLSNRLTVPLTTDELWGAQGAFNASWHGHALKHLLLSNTRSSVIYFIGDSTIRNQFLAFCCVLRNEQVMPVMTPHKFSTCNNRGRTQATVIAVFAWSPTLRPAMVQRLMGKGYEAPTHIYFNSGIHILHVDPTWPWAIENGYET